MGKTKNKLSSNTDESKKSEITPSASHIHKKSKKNDESQRIGAALREVELPKTAEGLSAEKLTADQKNVIKKHCQNMYGHRFSTREKLPANSLETAALQLEAKMKAKLEQRKKDKKNKSSV